MIYETFLKALVAGFLLSVPIGPVNLICIRSTLEQGRRPGLIAGLGAAAADGAYAFVAAVGLSAVTGFIASQAHWLRLFSGLFIIYIGIRSFTKPPADPSPQGQTPPRSAAFLKTLFITLANPVSILALISVMTAFNISAAGTRAAILVTLGVFTGSALWWFLLVGKIGRAHV